MLNPELIPADPGERRNQRIEVQRLYVPGEFRTESVSRFTLINTSRADVVESQRLFSNPNRQTGKEGLLVDQDIGMTRAVKPQSGCERAWAKGRTAGRALCNADEDDYFTPWQNNSGCSICPIGVACANVAGRDFSCRISVRLPANRWLCPEAALRLLRSLIPGDCDFAATFLRPCAFFPFLRLIGDGDFRNGGS